MLPRPGISPGDRIADMDSKRGGIEPVGNDAVTAAAHLDVPGRRAKGIARGEEAERDKEGAERSKK